MYFISQEGANTSGQAIIKLIDFSGKIKLHTKNAIILIINPIKNSPNTVIVLYGIDNFLKQISILLNSLVEKIFLTIPFLPTDNACMPDVSSFSKVLKNI
jgi:hypothetical protein